MGMSEGRGQVGKSMKDLTQLWLTTRGEWDDGQAMAFEKQYLAPLETNVRDALGAMDAMSALIGTIRRECGNE